MRGARTTCPSSTTEEVERVSGAESAAGVAEEKATRSVAEAKTSVVATGVGVGVVEARRRRLSIREGGRCTEEEEASEAREEDTRETRETRAVSEEGEARTV